MSDSEDERRAYRVHGKVQGVGFRWWTRLVAGRLGVRGRVCNLESGSVEVHAVGATTALEALQEALRMGPPLSRVMAVESIAPDDDLPAVGFHIENR